MYKDIKKFLQVLSQEQTECLNIFLIRKSRRCVVSEFTRFQCGFSQYKILLKPHRNKWTGRRREFQYKKKFLILWNNSTQIKSI